jgi:hypothetical protein
MRYYLVADDGSVILESVYESYAVEGQLAVPGTVMMPSAAALDEWRCEAGMHFFQVSIYNRSGEPYVVAELSWPLLSYWREQITDATMTLQKLHARHPDYAAQWLDDDDSAAERDRVLSNAAVRRDLLRDQWMLDLTYEEFVVRVPDVFGDAMPDDVRRAWFRAHQESLAEFARTPPPGA